MIRMIEALSAALSVAAYIGLVIALFASWRLTRRKELILSLFGIVLVEASRAIMIFGPGFAVEPGRTTLRLTEDSSLSIFLGNVLLMPIGYVVVAVGVVLFVWRYLRRAVRAA